MKIKRTDIFSFISGKFKGLVAHSVRVISLFIAPAYSRVRYRSSNFRPSVRSSVRSSVNIYVEVQFSRHQ